MDISPLVTVPYTLFISVFIPVYWNSYGILNFLYFCDVTLILTYIGIVTRNKLMISMAAVGILVPQILWTIDFVCTGVGIPFICMTDYMYQDKHSLLLRALSMFHAWLPVLLCYLIYKHGYEHNALYMWTLSGSCIITLCYFITDPPDGNKSDLIPQNINYVWGFGEVPQTMMHHNLWFSLVLFGSPILIYYPTHCLLKYIGSGQRCPVLKMN